MSDETTTAPETFTAEQMKEAQDTTRRGMAVQLADMKTEMSELLKEKEERDEVERKAEEQKLVDNQEYEKALATTKAEFEEFKTNAAKTQKEQSDKTLNLTLENAGMSDPLARAGAVALYDGTDEVAWMAALQEANPNSFIAPKPNAVGTTNAPAANVNSGQSSVISSEEQAEQFKKSTDPAQRQLGRAYLEDMIRRQ